MVVSEPKVRTGQWVILFGTAAHVINVVPSRAFPDHALDVLVCTVEGVTTTLVVAADYEPLMIDWAYTPTVAGGALPRRPL